MVAGIEGPIVTQIRALLTPQPLKELRVKNQYISHKELPGSQGVKITAKDLEKALAGIPLFVAQQPDEVDFFKVWRELSELATLTGYRRLCFTKGASSSVVESYKTSFVVLSFVFIVQLESVGKWTYFHALAVFSTPFLISGAKTPVSDSKLSSFESRHSSRDTIDGDYLHLSGTIQVSRTRSLSTPKNWSHWNCLGTTSAQWLVNLFWYYSFSASNRKKHLTF